MLRKIYLSDKYVQYMWIYIYMTLHFPVENNEKNDHNILNKQ